VTSGYDGLRNTKWPLLRMGLITTAVLMIATLRLGLRRQFHTNDRKCLFKRWSNLGREIEIQSENAPTYCDNKKECGCVLVDKWFKI
jgi:hypothetical protein